MTLVLPHADLHTRTAHLAALPPDERRRRATEAARDKDAGTLWLLAEAYLTLHGEAGALLSAHTRRSYRTGVRLFVAHAGAGAWNLLRPERDLAQTWVNELLLRQGRSIGTVRSRVAAAALLYRALRWAGATQATPFEDVVLPRDRRHPLEKNPPYSEAVLERVYARLRAGTEAAPPRTRTRWLQTRLLVLLLAHSGLRIQEALDLTWADVDLTELDLTVRSGKGRRSRLVPLTPPLAHALRAARLLPRRRTHRGDRVFSFRDRASAAYHVAPLFAQEDGDGGTDWRGFHAFRKAMGSRLYEELGDFVAVAEVLGHADVNTTRGYVRVGHRRAKRAMGTWGGSGEG
ncbi:tyrosine-type recombinase/integrase [Deinococcus sp. YIM 134068]|uniref:tyrosine-type recombinase/integrase n=1 Tax=Deinococcus lichenicola TaxID=3118910 RepID=UPI002F92E5B6